MKKAITILLAASVSLTASAAPLSSEAAEAIKSALPLAFYGLPAGKSLKVNPLLSAEKRRPDRSVTVNLKTSELVLLSISEDGKCAEVIYPEGKGGGTFTTGWFKIEDVLSPGKAAPRQAEAGERLLLYSPWGEKRPTLVGYAEKGTHYTDFGERRVGREAYNLALLPGGTRPVNGRAVSGRLVYVRERKPATDAATYVKLVNDLMAEEVYQHAKPWGSDKRPILVENGNLGCAAFVTDFARYVFDAGNFNKGERFDKPEDIRAGDVISIKGHFLAVLDRSGDKLVTMEGNFNSAVWQSDANYALQKGAWVQQGKLDPDNFICGYHYLDPAPAKPIGIRLKRK